MGCSLTRHDDRGVVVRGGTKPTHKPPGAQGASLCDPDICQGANRYTHLTEDGQHHCHCLCEQHGSHNLATCASELWHWCLDRGITIAAEHLPGEKNVAADAESRTLRSSAEWRLHPTMFQHVVQVLGPCEIDLFATRLNSQLPQYISWRPDPFSVAVDAFMVQWTKWQGYAFPFSLIGRCLRKVWTEGATLLIVAPVWPMQSWYPVLLELLVDLPLLLPIHQDLLHDPFNRPHPLLIQGSLQGKCQAKTAGAGNFTQSYKPYLGRMEQGHKCGIPVSLEEMDWLV